MRCGWCEQELLEVFVVGLAPEDSPCQVEVRCRQIPDDHNGRGEQKERTRAYSKQLESSMGYFSRHHSGYLRSSSLGLRLSLSLVLL